MHQLHIQHARHFSEFPRHTDQKCCAVLLIFYNDGLFTVYTFLALQIRGPFAIALPQERELSLSRSNSCVKVQKLNNLYYHNSDLTSIWWWLNLMHRIKNPNAFQGVVLEFEKLWVRKAGIHSCNQIHFSKCRNMSCNANYILPNSYIFLRFSYFFFFYYFCITHESSGFDSDVNIGFSKSLCRLDTYSA